MPSVSDVNLDHADLLEASGKFDHDDYQEWWDRQRDDQLMDQWWCERFER